MSRHSDPITGSAIDPASAALIPEPAKWGAGAINAVRIVGVWIQIAPSLRLTVSAIIWTRLLWRSLRPRKIRTSWIILRLSHGSRNGRENQQTGNQGFHG